MTDHYIASDYAGLSGGAYSFYYGYEETVEIPTNGEDEEQDLEWCFVAKKNGEEFLRIPQSKLKGVSDEFDVIENLLAGIAQALEVDSENN